MKSELLDRIIATLRLFKDDEAKLQQLYQYIMENLCEKSEGESINVPKQYLPLVKEIADSLSADLVCYVHPDTLEKVDIPKQVLDEISFDFMEEEEEQDAESSGDDDFYTVLKRIEKEWNKVVIINPPESPVAFRYMERFTDGLSEGRLRAALYDALSKRKPFSRFNAIIHQSEAREEWFTFRQKCLEEYTAELLIGHLPGFDFDIR